MRLAQRGVRVAIHYRGNRRAAQECLAALAGSGHALFAADLSQPAAAPVLWQQVVERLDAIDILINNAGLYLDHSPLKTGYDA